MRPPTTRCFGSTVFTLFAACAITLSTTSAFGQYINTYHIVDTGQQQCYSNSGPLSTAPTSGQAFFGQDAQHVGNQPQYHDNGDGTISDLVTGLMWVKARGSKMSWEKALADAASCSVGSHSDWRMPTIKELYSLIDFRGKSGATASTSRAYLDTNYFGFAFGNLAVERLIDCQDWSATTYVHLTMNGDSTAFGVNFADGRIKGYGKRSPQTGARTQLYVRYVRGNASYGVNNFVDNQDSTITDRATGLMWTKADSRGGMNWQSALAYVRSKNTAGYYSYNDWRLPNAKELQSIVDYARSPSTSGSAAINPVFLASSIGGGEYPYYWTSTSHLEGAPTAPGGEYAVYLSFGRALGWMPQPPNSTNYVLLDVHGAGAQRSDPKTGDPANYPHGHGPQGDVIRIQNYVRLVRSGTIVPVELSSFGATLLPGMRSVRLDWKTETEVNNLGFSIERRCGEEDEWTPLPGVFIAGQGSSTIRQEYEYTDALPAAGVWWYRLRQIDTDGTQVCSRAVRVYAEADAGIGASGVTLGSFPNPFGGGAFSTGYTTMLTYTLPRDASIVLRVFDQFGRQVALLADGMRQAGVYQSQFNAAGLPDGVYVCRLEASGASITRKVILLR